MRFSFTSCRRGTAGAVLLALPLALALGFAPAAQPPPGAESPEAAARRAAPRADYDTVIKPLLTARCAACHGGGTRLGDFSIDSSAALLKGGAGGAAVVPGHSEMSLLVKLVSGDDPNRVMPQRGQRLTPGEIELLRTWIDQGASFGQKAAGEAIWEAPLEPRRPAVPSAVAGSGISNPIDRLLQPYFRGHHISPKPIVDDRTFARRVYLDVVGLPPPPGELEAFIADRSKEKRAFLVRRLLSRSDDYATHYLTFWNDILRNDYAGTGYIDGGRTQITDWLYRSLADNKPYDKFVAELVNPTPESAGFIKGIVWRGVVNASQTPQMQAAQNVSQAFMGVNLKCASCHNSFVSTWKLADAYGLASVYSDKPLELVRCDRPTGQIAAAKFIYPQLGEINPNAPKLERMERLAAILTAKTNGRLARTFVNRLWAKLLGRGLVEPTDDMDSRPWDPDLLDWLAADFADSGFDVKHTIETIVTSRAYQMPSAGLSSERAVTDENFIFAGPCVKRLSAEQYVDGVSALTGVWSHSASAIRIVKGVAIPPPSRRFAHSAIAFQSDVLKSGSVTVDVDVTHAGALSLVVTDAGDGIDHDWTDWVDPVLVDAHGHETPLTSLAWYAAATGHGKIQVDKSTVEKPLRLGDTTYAHGIGTHANSIITYLLPPGFTRFRAAAGPDTGGVEDGQGKASVRISVITGDRTMFEGRAALALADPLTRALGRPNREQVVTERSTVATTLQALELTNGRTLGEMIAAGAARWSADRALGEPEILVNAIYEQGLGRMPTPAERHDAVLLVRSGRTRKDGVEDLLWAVTMLPDFQLVY